MFPAPGEAELLLRDAAARDDRVYLRLSGQGNTEPRSVVPGRFLPVPEGAR